MRQMLVDRSSTTGYSNRSSRKSSRFEEVWHSQGDSVHVKGQQGKHREALAVLCEGYVRGMKGRWDEQSVGNTLYTVQSSRTEQ